jgi:hypothetical protein
MGGNFPIAKILIKGGDNQEVTGTYMPNELITHIASWVSVKFAFMVSDIVKEYMIREYKESIREKDTKIDDLMRELKIFREESKQEIRLVINQNTQVIRSE